MITLRLTFDKVFKSNEDRGIWAGDLNGRALLQAWGGCSSCDGCMINNPKLGRH